MANAKKTNVKTEKMELVVREEPRIVLEMTEDEAAAVRGVLGRVSGGVNTYPVFEALGLVDYEKYRETYRKAKFGPGTIF
jgi:hypothetical protein